MNKTTKKKFKRSNFYERIKINRHESSPSVLAKEFPSLEIDNFYGN